MKTLLALLTALFVVGCGEGCGEDDPPESGKARRTIHVVGIGKAKTLPDQVEITIKAEFTRPRMRDAVQETQNTMDEVLHVARKYVRESIDIKTSSISANKEYDYVREKEVFKGYQASQAVDITLKDITRFEKFTEEILTTRISNIENLTFSHSKADSILREVDLLAIDDAHTTARKICERTKVKLGRILRISNHGPNDDEEDGNPYPRYYGNIGLYGKGIGGRGIQISPEILIYSKTAYVTYEID